MQTFVERHHAYQIAHALAGRARRCGCCDTHLPAHYFEGPSLICDPCGDDIDASMEAADRARFSCDDGRGRPPKGSDMCPRGCQPLYGLGECGMCGYEGDGVWDDATTEVVDACEETGRYTRQTRDGYCYGCGKYH